MATLTISIDRTSLSLAPLVFSGSDDGTTWGILPGFQQPGRIARNRYATSPWVDGDVQTGTSLQQAILSWSAFPDVASAAALQTAVDELLGAVGQDAGYTTTVTWNGVASVWTCDTGSAVPAGVDFAELEDNQPVYSVTIPCYPRAA